MTPRQKIIFEVAQIFCAMEMDAHFKKNNVIQKDGTTFLDSFFTANPKQKKLWDDISKQIALLRKEGVKMLEEANQ